MLLLSTPVTFSNDVKRCLALEVGHELELNELNELELEDDEQSIACST